MTRNYLLAALLLGATLALADEPLPPEQSVVFILDASGSMWAEMEGGHRITVAREVMGEVIGSLPEATEAALVAYGHRRRGDCEDIETLIELGPLDRAAFIDRVEGINPRGMTPITGSVEHALDAMRTIEHHASVVLISDGLENCGGDPCATVRAAKEMDIDFSFHVVGFAMGDLDATELKCMAEAGGGRYVSADNTAELVAAMGTVLETEVAEPETEVAPERPPADGLPGRLVISVLDNGAPRETATVFVVDSVTRDSVVPESWLDLGRRGNPRTFEVPAGSYDIRIRSRGIWDNQEWLRGVAVDSEATVEQAFDYETGALVLSAVVDGEPVREARFTLYSLDQDRNIGSAFLQQGRTNPRTLRLRPGAYDVRVHSRAGQGGSQWVRGIQIETGSRVERVVDFSPIESAEGNGP